MNAQGTATATRLTTAAGTIKSVLTKDKLRRFVFGTRERTGVGQQILVYGLLICIGFVYLYPILYMISTSLMSMEDLLDTSVKWIPGSVYLQNYKDAARSMEFWKTFGKSIAISAVPTLCNVVICMMVGYGFAKYDFKGRKIMMGILYH